MARKPATTWAMLNQAMRHYQAYIVAKPRRYELSIVDLLHVSNLKGGNASITESPETLVEKLRPYEQALELIAQRFPDGMLAALNEEETTELVQLCDRLCALTGSADSRVRGFGPSYASALIAAHFIDLVPILDRRILNGAGIEVEHDRQGQVKNIRRYYGQLIRACQAELQRRSGMSLRELDQEWFAQAL